MMRYVLGVFLLGLFVPFFASAYTPNVRDAEVMESIDARVAFVADSGGKEYLVSLFGRVIEKAPDLEEQQDLYILEYILEAISAHLEKTFAVEMTWDALIDDDIDVDDDEIVANPDDEEDEEDEEYTIIISVVSGDSSMAYSLSGFYDTYKGYITSSEPISKACVKYRDEIDEIAQEYDFPTALIVATWYREHTCKFENPANGRGNFQITSHYYPAGDIDRDDFKNQVVNFIAFSKAKWEYYDDVQTYGEAPIALTYDTIDLDSLRKHAIFYNGINGELDTNPYANQNFGRAMDGKDGIVAMTIRAIGWQLHEDRTGVLQTEDIKDTADEVEEDEEDIENEDKIEDTEDVVDEEIDEQDCVEGEKFTVDLGSGATHPEVLAMQNFLVAQGWYQGDPNGVYDDKSSQAVSAFQAYYKEDILDPGGYTAPTGYWYPATRRKANTLVCE